MEQLTFALVEYARYRQQLDREPSWSRKTGPMRRKLRRLHGEAAQAICHARAFDFDRTQRIWQRVEREIGDGIAFSSRDLDPERWR